MKTINELNQKAWYRFFKVIFIFLFLAILGLTILFFSDYTKNDKYVDNDRSYYLCGDGRKIIFNQLKPNDKIGVLCAYDPMNPPAENSFKYVAREAGVDLEDDYLIFTHYNFNRWLVIFFYGLVVLAVFELIRRAFYYIALGSINPPKK